MTGSYEDQAIILADSGMLQATAEKKHLVMSLWSGEWFENMRSQELAGSASVPYRRETFITKRIVLDYDGDFSMTDAASISNDARTKSLAQIKHDADSLKHDYDSIGRAYYKDDKIMVYRTPQLTKERVEKAEKMAKTATFNVDSVYSRLSIADKQRMLSMAQMEVQSRTTDLDFKAW